MPVRIGRARWLIILGLVFLLLGAFFVLRAGGSAEVGPLVALCPGPDEFGYTCTASGAYPYVDATVDQELFEDDALVEVLLPFPFSFYGTTYNFVRISSNGVLLFTGERIDFENLCLSPEPAAGMGDMIAPYWDDLNLAFAGVVQTEVIGEAPERVFVVEWDDVPSFANVDDRVTFEVQLHEGTGNITFLYEDVARQQGNRGSSATIGLQSESQGYALQLGCNQLVLRDRSAVEFLYPPDSNAGPEDDISRDVPSVQIESLPPAKGIVAQLVESLDQRGLDALAGLRAQWLAEQPSRESQLKLVDVNGDGRKEVVILWRGSASEPYLTQLSIVTRDGGGLWQPIWSYLPLARQDTFKQLRLHSVVDVTGDAFADIVLLDDVTGRGLIAVYMGGGFELHQLPGKCAGSLVVREGGTIPEIVRDGCQSKGRTSTIWTGNAFARK